MKNIEQKAEEYAINAMQGIVEKYQSAPWNEFRDALAEIYKAGAKEALAGQWIELTPNSSPPLNQEVLCLGDTGDVAVLQMVYTNLRPMGHQLTWLPKVKCRITHWMPIPELPKIEEQ